MIYDKKKLTLAIKQAANEILNNSEELTPPMENLQSFDIIINCEPYGEYSINAYSNYKRCVHKTIDINGINENND